ncbi:MAG: hypothetical protein C5B49_01650 [Bdellovibrio sp.]|nr:MAG: hypothetical protein C5B49_01650 [Bdellovibrio sp.]
MRLRDFQRDFNKNFELNFKKMTELFSEVSDSLRSPQARALFASALEFLKPHHLALGLRVAKLSRTRLEVVVPHRWRNQLEAEELDPGILTTASAMGAQLLMRRMDLPDLGPMTIEEIHFFRHSKLAGDLRGRLEFSKLAQEAFRAELKKKTKTKLELLMIFFDQFDRRVADCQIVCHCTAVQSLGWSEEPQAGAFDRRFAERTSLDPSAVGKSE